MTPASEHLTAATPVDPSGRPLAIPNPFGVGAGEVIKWIVKGITQAINAFFGQLVQDALNPLLQLLGQTLLTTPDPGTLPRLGPLWNNSREIAVAAYALLILVAGILVMAYETVQTRHSIKEIAPRIVVGFLTANLSLLLAGKAVAFANALSTGVMGGGVDPRSAAGTLGTLVMNAVTNGGIFLVFVGLGLACVLLALLVCYVIRVALTIVLIAGAPLALMCHALPQTEGIARWWWRAFAGVLAIQLAQSLTLVAALDVFLAQGGFTFFGPTTGGLVDLIVTTALLYILFKIPFWILHAIQVGGGRSFLGGVVKGVIAYKTLGLVGLRSGGHATHRSGPGAPGGPPAPGGPGGAGFGGGLPSGPGPHGGPGGGPGGGGRQTPGRPPTRGVAAGAPTSAASPRPATARPAPRLANPARLPAASPESRQPARASGSQRPLWGQPPRLAGPPAPTSPPAPQRPPRPRPASASPSHTPPPRTPPARPPVVPAPASPPVPTAGRHSR